MTNWLENSSDKQTLSVSQLNNTAKYLLESQFQTVWVEGEISNFSRPASGHWYFTLKDEGAQIRCAMFRGKNSRLQYHPKNGDAVIVRGTVSLYTARGDYQLIADNIREAGAGALQAAFDALKAKLQQQGWFNSEAKQILPERPKHIAVITSETGAVWHDIQQTFARRNPFATLHLIPVAVQGEAATAQIVDAFAKLEANHDWLDAVILARGGGSLEDLAAFNSEAVATAVYNCPIPVVAAVGHETDFSIAEFVADMRGATPTAAAELLSPDITTDKRHVLVNEQRLHQLISQKLDILQKQLKQNQNRLKHPSSRIDEQRLKTDELAQRLHQALQRSLASSQQQCKQLSQRLAISKLEKHKAQLSMQHQQLSARLLSALDKQTQQKQSDWQRISATLHSVSPLATLDRGYTIVKDVRGDALESINQVSSGQPVSITFNDGSAKARIE